MQFVSMEDIPLVESTGFKMEAGKIYRTSWALLPGFLDKGEPDFDAKPLFVQGNSLYAKGIGRVIDEGGQHSRISGENSKLYYSTVIISWPTNKKGEISTSGIEEKEYEVTFMRVTKKRLQDMYRVYDVSGAKIAQVDLVLDCKDAKFQDAAYSLPDATTKNRGLFYSIYSRRSDEKWGPIWEDISSKIKDVAENLESSIGRRIPIDEFRQKIAEVQARDGVATPMETSAPRVSAPANVVTSGLDDVLDDL
jgi:hypothetical protein